MDNCQEKSLNHSKMLSQDGSLQDGTVSMPPYFYGLIFMGGLVIGGIFGKYYVANYGGVL